ncbi:MAG: DegT/DnrJ/EryC1/StrS family aminotransferase [Candidatus Edwardsbacteria bacterium]|jgi:perosamine synthetase|nr:DegT/DnrJ/EryC1/StrS family aminotransferase [Candidatus Edwardsbacteria bacterium]
MIKLADPDITAREIAAVARVLRSGTLSLGPELAAFEGAFAKYVGRKHALAVCSGTAGLHLAVRALGLGPGDEVVTSPYSFIASVNCIRFEGARPVLADIDPGTFNLDPARAARKITRRTKALLPVDIFGLPADFDAFQALCDRHRLAMIEDSCEALGAEYRGRRCGSFGDASVFGFYANKQITTGEGGMVVCDDDALHRLMAAMRNQGRSSMGGWLAHRILGYNYRMSDLSAALGRVQLSRLPRLLARRQRLAGAYRKLFASQLPEFGTLGDRPGMARSWFVFAVLVPPSLKGARRDGLIKGLQESGIQCAHYFPALHLQPALRDLGHRRGDFPVAEDIADRSLAIPFHHGLTRPDQERIVRTIRRLV